MPKECNTTIEQLVQEGCDRACITAVIGEHSVCPRCDGCISQKPSLQPDLATESINTTQQCNVTIEQLFREGCYKECITAVIVGRAICPMCRKGCRPTPPSVTSPSTTTPSTTAGSVSTPLMVQKCIATTEQLLQEGCDRGCISAVIRDGAVCPICRDGCTGRLSRTAM